MAKGGKKNTGSGIVLGSQYTPSPVTLTDTSGFVKALIDLEKQKIPAVNYGQINKIASQSAGRDIGLEVGAYHTEQNRLTALGALQAKMINQVARAAAAETKPYAQNALNAYKGVAADQASFAAGASGDMRAAAESESAKLQASLQGMGSQQAPPAAQGGQLADVTQAWGGLLPARTLEQQGLSAFTAAQAIPQAFLGYGQQQGLGVIGAASQAAEKYNLDINKVLATRGKLTQEYATTYGEQARAVQKSFLDAKAAQAEMIKDMSDIVVTDNKQKLAVQAAEMKVAAYNETVRKNNNQTLLAIDSHNLTRSRINEQKRHNLIGEDQANTALALNNARLGETMRQNDISNNIAETNARTAIENSRGYYFLRDKNGKPYGDPQPTENHKIVYNKDGSFRSVLIHAGRSTGTAAARSKAAAITAAQKLIPNMVNGKLPAPVKDKYGNEYIPGFDTTLNAYTDPTLFRAAKGEAPMGYMDMIRVLKHQTGDKLSIPKIRSMINPYFAGAADFAAQHNLTLSEARDPSIINQFTNTGAMHDMANITPQSQAGLTSAPGVTPGIGTPSPRGAFGALTSPYVGRTPGYTVPKSGYNPVDVFGTKPWNPLYPGRQGARSPEGRVVDPYTFLQR